LNRDAILVTLLPIGTIKVSTIKFRGFRVSGLGPYHSRILADFGSTSILPKEMILGPPKVVSLLVIVLVFHCSCIFVLTLFSSSIRRHNGGVGGQSVGLIGYIDIPIFNFVDF
jgi:hypothetical protein